MDKPESVYSHLHSATTPERLWAALTSGERHNNEGTGSSDTLMHYSLPST